jgi:hypothetical protein
LIGTIAILLFTGLSGCQGKNGGTTTVLDSSWDKFSASSKGTTINGANGNVLIVLPGGAVDKDVTLGVRSALNPPVDPACIPNTAYEFGPDGINFKQPVQVMIKYSQDDLPENVSETSLKIVRLEQGSWIPISDSKVDPVNHTVTCTIHGFSTYSVKSWLEDYDPTWPMKLRGSHKFGVIEPVAYAIEMPQNAYCPVTPGGFVVFREMYFNENGDHITMEHPWKATFWWYLEGNIGVIGSTRSEITPPGALYEVKEKTWLSSTDTVYFKAFPTAEVGQTAKLKVRIEFWGDIIGEYSTNIEILTDVEIVPINIPDEYSAFNYDRFELDWSTTGKYGFLLNESVNPQTHITNYMMFRGNEFMTYRADADDANGGTDTVTVEVSYYESTSGGCRSIGKATATINIKEKETVLKIWFSTTKDPTAPHITSVKSSGDPEQLVFLWVQFAPGETKDFHVYSTRPDPMYPNGKETYDGKWSQDYSGATKGSPGTPKCIEWPKVYWLPEGTSTWDVYFLTSDPFSKGEKIGTANLTVTK